MFGRGLGPLASAERCSARLVPTRGPAAAVSDVHASCTHTQTHTRTAPLSSTPAALPACLGRLGSLPLVALAQLAAFVCQLIGRSFLDLADLDPEAFQVGGVCSVCVCGGGGGGGGGARGEGSQLAPPPWGGGLQLWVR